MEWLLVIWRGCRKLLHLRHDIYVAGDVVLASFNYVEGNAAHPPGPGFVQSDDTVMQAAWLAAQWFYKQSAHGMLIAAAFAVFSALVVRRLCNDGFVQISAKHIRSVSLAFLGLAALALLFWMWYSKAQAVLLYWRFMVPWGPDWSSNRSIPPVIWFTYGAGTFVLICSCYVAYVWTLLGLSPAYLHKRLDPMPGLSLLRPLQPE